MTKRFLAGIDVGGSKTYVAIAPAGGKIVGSSRQETPRKGSFDAIVQAIGDCFDRAVRQAGLTSRDIESVGVGVPGPVDEKGRVSVMPNLKLANVNVESAVSTVLGKRTHVENDVNLATLAEYHLGAGRGLKSLYGIVPGTGVGGGYVIEGKIVKGKNNTAGEIGHMVVQLDGPQCSCGQKGCLEAFVSRIGLLRELQEAKEMGEKSKLLDPAKDSFRSVGAVALKSAWDQGDAVTRRLLTRQAQILGVAVANVVSLTGVEGIVIGGGVYEKLGETLLPMVADSASKHAVGDGMAGVRLALSELKGQAVALGAIRIA